MTYTLIQGLRAILCISVAIIHVRIYLLQYHGYISIFQYVPDIIGAAPCGFFAISGYFMANMVDRTVPNFLPQRAVRIYPMYFLAIALAYVMRYFTSNPLDYKDFWLVLPLLPVGGHKSYKLGIEWTLTYEIYFYLICAFFCRPSLSRWFPKFLIVWFVLVTVWTLLNPAPLINHLPNMLSIWVNAWCFGFIAGALVYYLLKYYQEPAVQAWAEKLVLGSAFVAAAVQPSQSSIVLIMGLASCLLLIGLIRFEAIFQAPKVVTQMGDYSYSLYLIHPSIIMLVIDRWEYFTGERPGLIAGLFSLVLCLAAFWYLGQVDVGMHKRLKVWVNKLMPKTGLFGARAVVVPVRESTRPRG